MQLFNLSRREVVAVLAVTPLVACDKGPAILEDADDPDPIDPITSNEDHYVTSCCGTPNVEVADWKLTIFNGTTELASLDMDWLEQQDTQDKEHTLECISASPYHHAISNAIWTGRPLQELFDLLGVVVPDEAIEMVFTCADGYSTSLPVSDLDKPVWLVWRMNGEALPDAHGFPVRLLVPGRYGMKNPKWIETLSFVTEPYTGFWESYGWSNEATYRANALVRDPGRTSRVRAGLLRLQGTAYAGRDPVVAVEVRVDGGEWTPAEIDYAPGPDIWTLWHFDWQGEEGMHTLQARCTTESGAMSIDDTAGSDQYSGYDGSMEIEVEVV